MPEPLDLETLGPQIGAELAALVAPMLKRLEAETVARIDAATVRSGMIDREGVLVLTFGDGSSRALGVVVGRDGANGKDGKDGKDGTSGVDGTAGAPGRDGLNGSPGRDGLDLTGFDTALSDDGRVLTLSLEAGDYRVSHELVLPVLIYRGVFEPGRAYLPGDAVTYGGSVWVCGAPTAARPGEGEASWRLAVKRGRDGKDFAGLQTKVA